jgi:DNA repair protein RadD
MSAIQLRGYQEGAIGKIRSALARNRRVMLYSPTGSGKTEMAFVMVVGAVAKGRKVVFIANRKELVRQASRRLDAAGIAHGILQAENTRGLDAKVLVCSIDTVHRRGLPEDVGLIIIDEAHAVAGSVKYRELLFRYNLVPVVGLSATPFAPGLGKHHDKLRGPLFEALVEAVTIRELIDLGFLVDCDVFAPADPDLAGVKTQRSIGGEIDYNETQLAEAVDKPALVGDIVQHWQRLAAGKQTVCFASNIAHSQHIVAEFVRHGVKAAHLDYHHDDDERAAILDAFARGEITVLSNSALLAEGWGLPEHRSDDSRPADEIAYPLRADGRPRASPCNGQGARATSRPFRHRPTPGLRNR